jgi:hypothetical protein
MLINETKDTDSIYKNINKLIKEVNVDTAAPDDTVVLPFMLGTDLRICP